MKRHDDFYIGKNSRVLYETLKRIENSSEYSVWDSVKQYALVGATYAVLTLAAVGAAKMAIDGWIKEDRAAEERNRPYAERLEQFMREDAIREEIEKLRTEEAEKERAMLKRTLPDGFTRTLP